MFNPISSFNSFLDKTPCESNFYSTVSYIPIVNAVIQIWKSCLVRNHIYSLKNESLLENDKIENYNKSHKIYRNFNIIKQVFLIDGNFSNILLASLTGAAIIVSPEIGVGLALFTLIQLVGRYAFHFFITDSTYKYIQANFNPLKFGVIYAK